MSPERDQDYLCEGLAEELIDALTHVEGLRVAARTSSFQFRGESRPARGRAQARRRQSARRQRAQGRRPPAHHRAAHRRRHRAITSGRRSSSARRPTCSPCRTKSPKRWPTLLRGGALDARERRARAPPAHRHRDLRTLPARPPAHAHHAAAAHGRGQRRCIERAIALDAEYAPAWAGLAMLHALLYEWWGSHDADLQAADRASGIAMELAPELADAHLARAYTLSNLRRYAERMRAFRGRGAHQSQPVRRLLLLRTRGFRRRRHREIHRALASRRRSASRGFRMPALRSAILAQARPARRGAARSTARRCGAPNGCSRSTRRMRRVLSLVSGALLEDGQSQRAVEWALQRRSGFIPMTWR